MWEALAVHVWGPEFAFSAPTQMPKGPLSSPNSITNWGPSVQAHEPIEGISYSDHHNIISESLLMVYRKDFSDCRV